MQYVNATACTNATVTTITIMTKGMKVKFSGNIEGNGELNRNKLSVWAFLKGVSQQYLRNGIWYPKLKLTGLIVGEVELTQRQYLYLNATAYSHTTATTITTAAKAKGTAIYSAATTKTATSNIPY